jgi:hypothetical protein
MNSEQADILSSVFDHELNEALVNADIANGYEEFLAIFDRFYAEQVEVASDHHATGLVGKSSVLPVLFNFLVPLHVMAEIGGLAVTLRYSTIHSDKRGEQHAEWSLDLLGILGRRVTLHWSSVRRWKDAHVVYEHHYEHRQISEPLTLIDLEFSAPSPRSEHKSDRCPTRHKRKSQ